MGLRINNNIAAMNAYRNLSATDNSMSKSLEKLSSGFRINRAADDAAGLSISEGLRSQIGGLKQAVRNAQDGVNVVQTADGALNEVTSILQRMRDLAVQASNTGSQDPNARQAAQTEITQLNSELDRIAKTTAFGGANLLDGTYGGTSATAAAGLSGKVSTTSPTGYDFDLSAMQLKLDGSVINGATVAASTSTAKLTGGKYLENDGTTNAAAGHYNSASVAQADLQKAVDTALSGTTGYTAGDVKVSISDAGNGVWKVALSSDKSTSISVAGATAGDYGFGSTATVGTGGTGTGGVFQVGSSNTSASRITVKIGDVSSGGSLLNTSAIDVTGGDPGVIDTLDAAIKNVSTLRANLGAYQNRFEHTINNLNVSVQNLTASESQIRDTDMAQEMTNFTRNQILSQAGTAMLAQANQASQGVLQLLRG